MKMCSNLQKNMPEISQILPEMSKFAEVEKTFF